MSSIGSGPLGMPPLVSSAAGASAQQKAAETNRANHDGQVQKFQLDRADQFEKAVGDIGASDGTDERDADGRMPWTIQRKKKSDGTVDGDVPAATHPPDLSAERGTQLDLDA